MVNGLIGEYVNYLKENLKDYFDDVEWMINKVDVMVSDYEIKGVKVVKSDDLIEYWELVKFYSVIEINYVLVYVLIW